MTIPEQSQEILNDLAETQQEIVVIAGLWGDLTEVGKTAYKTRHANKIDATITKLNDLKDDINAL